MSMELHTSIRLELNPDPEFDPIRMLFYTVMLDGTGITIVGCIFITDGSLDSQVCSRKETADFWGIH